MAARNEPTHRNESASGIVWPPRLVFAWGAGLLLFIAIASGRVVGEHAAAVLTELAWAIASAVATVSCLRAARVLSGRDRLAWLLFALACGTWSIGRLVCLVHELRMQSSMPFPGAADLGQLALGPLMILALLVLRSTQRERRLTWLRVANLGLILCGLANLLILMLAQPFLYAEFSLGSSLIVVIESAPVTGAFVLGLYVLWSYRWDDRFESIALITVALLLHMISALFYTRELVTTQTTTAEFFKVGWLLAFACQQWAGESQVAMVKHGDVARAQAMLEREGWVEALVPGVLVMCVALTGIALRKEITPSVLQVGAILLALFATVLALREGLLYRRGQNLRLQLQRASTELDESRERLRDIDMHRTKLEREIELTARAGGVGLWDWDVASQRVRYTREWKRQLGYADHEIEDSLDEWRTRVHPDDLEPTLSSIRQYIANPQGEFVMEQRLRHRDGSYRWILVKGAILVGDDGTSQRMLGAHIDITDRKNMELSLRESERRYRELVDSLEFRVAERTRELTEAYRESQSFAYAVAHDLKAPLRAIDGFSHLLEQSAHERLSPNEQAYIKRVRHGAIHMASLIDGLLAYSRLEHRELRLGPVDCRDLIESVVRSMEPIVHAANAAVSVTIAPVRVQADTEALSVVIRNLLDNALKFTSRARQPRVDIGGYEEGECMIITVRDNGIGFDPQYYDKIFEISNRLHSTGYEGTGMGLALVRKAVHRMHGSIWAQSAPDEGATFYVRLPLANENK